MVKLRINLLRYNLDKSVLEREVKMNKYTLADLSPQRVLTVHKLHDVRC